MIEREPLPLHEEVLLLALRDEKGTIAPGTMYQYALAGAIVAELILRKRVAVDEDGKKKTARVVNERSMGAPILDECLAMIAEDKPRTLDHWVGKFSSIRRLKHRVAERLCSRGILREEEGKVLIVFSRKLYPETDPRPEQEIVERLRRAIFTDERLVDPRTAVLISLTDATSVLKVVFDKKDLKRRKERIEEVVSGELLGKAARDAVEAMQAAVMVATIMPAIIAATVVN